MAKARPPRKAARKPDRTPSERKPAGKAKRRSGAVSRLAKGKGSSGGAPAKSRIDASPRKGKPRLGAGRAPKAIKSDVESAIIPETIPPPLPAPIASFTF